MKTKTKTKSLTIGILLILLLQTNTSAQVTIGSSNPPLEGALLDLKEDGTTTKGLGMPRVKLTDKDNLYPIFTPGSTEYSGANKTAQDKAHTGLWVYNINKCEPLGSGIYVWDGDMWNRLGAIIKPLSATVTFTASDGFIVNKSNLVSIPDTIHIPSGLDARGAITKDLSLSASWESVSKAKLTPTWQYTTSPAMISGTSPWTHNVVQNNLDSPLDYTSLVINDMSGIPDINNTPWKSRQWTLKYDIAAGNECSNNQPISKTLVLNQTNYKFLSFNNGFKDVGVTLNTLTTPSSEILIKNRKTYTFRIKGNAGWKMTIKGNKNLIDHNIPTSGGSDIVIGSYPFSNDFTFVGIAGTLDTPSRYETATIEITDTNPSPRAEKITVNIKSCIGLPNMSGITEETADNSNRADWENAWGTQVIRHLPKIVTPGDTIYHEFYSSDFGDAGRWMTTNLAANSFDGNVYTGGDATAIATGKLTGPSNNTTSYTEAHWSYPSPVGAAATPLSDYEYRGNPFLGYLYTWDAASAGKGGPTGTSNVDSGTNANEAGIPEWDGTGVQPSNTQMRRQGICPIGWHLPSDWEWVELQQEIIKNTSRYADMNDINNTDPTDGGDVVQNSSIGWHGTTHGNAMKETCTETYYGESTMPEGRSIKNGGFAAMTTGRTGLGQTHDVVGTLSFWSSSNYNSTGNYSYYLWFTTHAGGVYRSYQARYTLAAVRCKKD